MFTRFRNWLRAIVAEEVAKVSISLDKERSEAVARLRNVENGILRSIAEREAAFAERIKGTLEVEHSAFETRLRQTREHIWNGEPSRWQAEPEQVAADHALKLVK